MADNDQVDQTETESMRADAAPGADSADSADSADEGGDAGDMGDMGDMGDVALVPMHRILLAGFEQLRETAEVFAAAGTVAIAEGLVDPDMLDLAARERDLYQTAVKDAQDAITRIKQFAETLPAEVVAQFDEEAPSADEAGE